MTRILLADDHPLMLSGIEAVLRNSSYEIAATVRDGNAALDALATVKPDVLVLDIKMPKRSGVDVLRMLRARGDKRPVVLLTATIADGQLLEVLDLDVNGIVLKDQAGKSLIECLDSIERGARWIDQSLLQRAYDLARGPQEERAGPLSQLTPRERTVVALVAQGLRNKEIADDLGMSEGTVKVYVHRIYEKLGIQSRVELALLGRDTLQ